MRIAYLITAYTDPNALARLVKALKTDYADFYIHIDKKVKFSPFVQAIYKMNTDWNHIIFLKGQDRTNVYWGVYADLC